MAISFHFVIASVRNKGHVIYYGATLKDALLDYNYYLLFSAGFIALNLVIFILYLRITRLEQKAATRMCGVLVWYDRNDHRARAGSDGKKKKSEVFFRPLPTIVFAPDALLIIKYIPKIGN